jgi:uncharacterized iron-regulated membrane protein
MGGTLVTIFWRKFHRWLGLIMAIPITAWMASGLFFSIYPVEKIRGEHLTREPDKIDAAMFASLGSTAKAVGALDRHFSSAWSLESIGLTGDGQQAFWRIRGTVGGIAFTRLVDARGAVLPPLTESRAAQVAADWLLEAGTVSAVEWVSSVAPGSEYRGGPLPAWRVRFHEPETLHLYLDPWSGEIQARRTARWRIFDFFWMLHVMDFGERDNFNHPLLQFSASLGLLVALGGVVLWMQTSKLFRRRKRFMQEGR